MDAVSKRILIVDDEPRVVQLIRGYLEQAGYQVSSASTGPDALIQFEAYRPALLILDLMLPGFDGLEVARRIRKKSEVPIIMLTARTEEMDRVVGLESGADDYVSKPFSPRELVSRVRAVLRRAEGGLAKSTRLEHQELQMDLERREVFLANCLIELTPLEFDLLALLMENPGRVFTRLQILESLRGVTYESFARAVDTHVKRLRQKIEPDSQNPKFVLTVYGVGYKFATPKTDAPYVSV
jgi:DNA-binding response OmpR family regulator